MKEEKMKTHLEVFVCQKDSCAKRGSKEVADKLKKWAKEEHGKDIRIYRSGCLNQCDHGVAMAVYPEKKFLINVKEDDVKEIKEGLLETLKKFRN
jgi:(2Fe-2S) ferredoxin